MVVYRKEIKLWLVLSLLFLTTAIQAALVAQDSLKPHYLKEVVVTEKFHIQEITNASASPMQIMTLSKLKATNSLQLSDAVKHFAGVTIKDYGGIGGLKTISIRSLGAHHTTIGYDGITISNCQTGQIDLSHFSLDNVDQLSLSNGQSDAIFRPARFFATAGVLDIRTVSPTFKDGDRWNWSGSVKTGSFGLINPSVRVEHLFNKRHSAMLNVEWMGADGRYPYTLHYGGKKDSISHEKRHNSKVDNWRVEGEWFAKLSPRSLWRTKAYFYSSFRQLPNATTFYNDKYYSNLRDRNFFVQSRFEKELSKQFSFKVSAKYTNSFQRYHDGASLVTSDLGTNTFDYLQDEYYVSGSLLYRAFSNFSVALNSDLSLQTMDAVGLYQFADPTRYSNLTALAAKYQTDKITVSASLLATTIKEDVKNGKCAGNHQKLSPYLSFNYRPWKTQQFFVRAFYKKSFRMPSFNDLYYTRVGNPDLIPEYATQYNLGLTWSHRFDAFLSYLSFTSDLYYNHVTDKIVAIPTKNIFEWTMVNLGKVDVKGVDLTATAQLALYKDIALSINGSYTYQHALDVTGQEGRFEKVYKHQIAYTPRVSGSMQTELLMPWFNIAYSLIYSGDRFVLGQNIPENRLAGYVDQSVSINRQLSWQKRDFSVSLELLNLTDENYSVVKYFPMPGRSFRATIKMKL